MRCANFLLLLLVACSLFGPACNAQRGRQTNRNGPETDSGSLWRARYNNCDYGYFVLLDPGVVAHSTPPPSPNHGFLIPLPEMGRKSPATDSEARFLWVDASYDSWDDSPSLARAVASEIRFSEENIRSAKLIARRPTTLAGLKASFFEISYLSSVHADAVDEETIALRSDIVYTVGLRTDKLHQAADVSQMKRIAAGFRLTKFPVGECAN